MPVVAARTENRKQRIRNASLLVLAHLTEVILISKYELQAI